MAWRLRFLCGCLTARSSRVVPRHRWSVRPPSVVLVTNEYAALAFGGDPRAGSQGSGPSTGTPGEESGRGSKRVRSSWPGRNLNLQHAEAKLMEILSIMHFSSVMSGVPTVDQDPESVANKVSSLLNYLETANPPPRNFDARVLNGLWRLEYTTHFPPAVLAQDARENVTDMSVVLSIREDGTSVTTANISLEDGERRLVNMDSYMAQVDATPRFLVSDRDGGAFSYMDVTYISTEFLVLRNNFGAELDRMLTSNGIAGRLPLLDVYRKELASSSDKNSASFWPFSSGFEWR